MLLAFVLTNTAGLPEASAIADAYAAVGGERPIAWDGGVGDGEKLGLTVGGASVVMAAMPAPVPEGEAEDAARLSLSAVAGGWTLPEHRYHIIAVATNVDEQSGLPVRRDFTRLVAAVARAGAAVGIYWGAGPATHDPDFFFERIRDDELPLVVWIGISVARDEERVSLLSMGMRQFGMDDLLLTAPIGEGGAALEMFIDLLQYAVGRGATVVAGETVGRSDRERVPVTRDASPIDPEARVWRVDLPG